MCPLVVHVVSACKITLTAKKMATQENTIAKQILIKMLKTNLVWTLVKSNYFCITSLLLNSNSKLYFLWLQTKPSYAE